MDWGGTVTYLAETSLKGRSVPFGIKDQDRFAHVCVMGRAGSGRAALLARMALQDIERGVGTVILDASGNLAPLLVERLSKDVRERLIFLDPADAEYPFSWNPLDEFRALPSERALPVLSSAIASLYRIPSSALTDTLASHLLSNNESTMLTAYDLLTDPVVREKAFGTDSDERKNFETIMSDAAESVAIVTEQGRYLAKDSLVRNLIGQSTSKFSLAALEKGGIIVVDLSRIRMFPTRITPLVRLFTHAARSRGLSNSPVTAFLHDCLRYLAEEDIDRILPERSVALVIAESIHTEEDKPLRDKALARSGSVIAFSSREEDLASVEHLFYPYVSPEELALLEEGECCIALTIDSVRSRPFYARALSLPERTGWSAHDALAISRERSTTPRIKVDQLFKEKGSSDEKSEKGKGKDDDPGSFSSAFRSIFAKQAGTTGAPSAPAKPGTTTETEKVKETKEAKKAPAAVKPSEIPEEELRRMLYVEPMPA